MHLSWPLDESLTDSALETLMFHKESKVSKQKRMPDFNYIQKELHRNGVNKKLLWTEYLEECRQSGDEPLMYSQFCYYIQQDEQKRRATMHINRKPGEQIEVDWAGDPAQIIDPDTGEIIPAFLFVGVMTYSQYPFVEAFINEKQRAWITAHVHMYEYFGGVTRILVPDNTTTAVLHNNDWYNQELNTIYHEMAEHYNTAIIPARVRAPKDKPNAEGSVGVISTWITAALRNEQFFSLAELNKAIRIASHRRLYGRKGRHSTVTKQKFPLFGQVISKTPDRHFQRTGISNVFFQFYLFIESYMFFTCSSKIFFLSKIRWKFLFGIYQSFLPFLCS